MINQSMEENYIEEESLIMWRNLGQNRNCIFIFFFGPHKRLVVFQFPDHLNPGHGSENTEFQPLDHEGTPSNCNSNKKNIHRDKKIKA